jgi:hypothetical protein
MYYGLIISTNDGGGDDDDDNNWIANWEQTAITRFQGWNTSAQVAEYQNSAGVYFGNH